jgi:hypothetical protein
MRRGSGKREKGKGQELREKGKGKREKGKGKRISLRDLGHGEVERITRKRGGRVP